MAKTGLPFSSYPRLIRIKFPWMEVQDERLMFLFMDLSDCPSSVLHRQKPEIPTPARWPIQSPNAHGCHRNLEELSLRFQIQGIGETWSFGESVEVVADGKYA